MSRRVVEAAFHRNGVGGEGFYVAVIADEGRRFLLTWFPVMSDPENEVLAPYQSRVAVVALDEAIKGNVYMHPQPGRPGTGGNAWRGADKYGDLLPLIREVVNQDHDALMASLRVDAKAQAHKE